jgi:ER lumen protein retaining receptor
VSLKTQFLYMLVFLTRYVDLFFNFLSLYNTVMKVIFIGSAVAVCYVMKFLSPYCETYDKKYDVFFLPYIIVPCAILALLVNEYFSFTEVTPVPNPLAHCYFCIFSISFVLSLASSRTPSLPPSLL